MYTHKFNGSNDDDDDNIDNNNYNNTRVNKTYNSIIHSLLQNKDSYACDIYYELYNQ